MVLIMFIIGVAFAAILDQRGVYHWFYPKRTWVTVVIGVILCGFPWGVLWLMGIVEWFHIVLYATIFAACGAPIGIWQHRNGKRFDAEEKEIREEK